MRKLESDRMDWADGTIRELALRAKYDAQNHNALATRLCELLVQSPIPSMAVHSFISSINMNMRIVQRLAKNPAAYERMTPQKLIDILCADIIPNTLQLQGIAKTAQMDVAVYDELERILTNLTREQTPPRPSHSLAAALEEQSEIVAFGAEQRERLRRMAGASSSFERTVA